MERNIAVIIINWNASDDTLACIESVKEWRRISSDVYIIDNNSSEDDLHRLKNSSHQFKLIVNRDNLGYSGANNIGIASAIADGHQMILLLNNDARILEDDITRLYESLKDDPTVGVIGPVVYDPRTDAVLNAGGKEIGIHYITHHKNILRSDRPYDVDYVSGTVFLARSKVFQAVGLLDERYFFSGEIADLCKRIRRQRDLRNKMRVVIDPSTRAFHEVEIASDHRDTLYTYYTVRNRYLYLKKFMGIAVLMLLPYWMCLHLKHAYSCMKHRKPRSAMIIVKGIVHGITGKYGRIPYAWSVKSD
jgi:hypothetical protein